MFLYPDFALLPSGSSGLDDIGYKASPTFADIDGDKDMDAFVGDLAGNTHFFRNTGTASIPEFSIPILNPFGFVAVGSYSNPTFIDIDVDGDMDAFVGELSGNTHFFRNTGTANNPTFAAATANPFGLEDVGLNANPTFADIDGDGDFDAFIGNYYGKTMFLRNTGTINNPVFAAPEANPFGLDQVISEANPKDVNPNFVDIDGDGDLDAFISSAFVPGGYGYSSGGDTLFFENKGTASNPSFSSPESNFFGLDGFSINPTFVDIDDDGDLDAFAGEKDGTVSFFVNNSGALLISTAGNDILTGTAFNNNDTVSYATATAPVTINLNVNTQQNTIGAGLDTLISIENLIGSPFNDNLTGNSANNVLRGGDGSDTLRGWSGADNMLGGFGDDIYFVENVGDIVNENIKAGIDTVSSNVTYTIPKNFENLILAGILAINGIGNNENNKLTGNAANNTLSGEWGDDIINGGAGEDTLMGGFGNDQYIIDNANDVIVENPPFFYYGTDSVSSSVSYTLSDYVENLMLTGTLSINGTGNNQVNHIIGNTASNHLNGGSSSDMLDGGAGDDTLIGGIGKDTMSGGIGNDAYFVENINDIVIENNNEGIDRVNTNVTYTLPSNIENLTLTNASAINGIGNNQNNIIVGNNAANQINGYGGDDTLIGGAGNDTLTGWSGLDLMEGGSGNDNYFVENLMDKVIEKLNEGIDIVNSKLTFTLPTNVENLNLTGTSPINGTGNILNNVIVGNNVANQLNGGAGSDILDGGLGTNKLSGSTGNDFFRFSTKGHVDQITDFNVANDTIQLENSIFTSLTTAGTLAANQFRTGTQALDANDFIVYNNATGTLLYDADGNNGNAAVQIVTVGVGLNLTHSDIVVI